MKPFYFVFTLFLFFSCKEEKPTTVVKTDSEKPVEKQEPKKIDPNKTYVYLTFDDGPVPGTMNIMKVAKEKNIPVTFFEIGQNIGKSAPQRKILEDLKSEPLATVGNHSYTHASGRYNYFYSRPDVVLKDFLRSKDTLRLKTMITRMPGRNIWRLKYVNKVDNKRTIPAADLLAKNGFEIYGWDVEWQGKHKRLVGDFQNMFARIKEVSTNHHEATPKHVVLLTHDYYFESEYGQDQLRKLIDQIKSDSSYAFGKLEDYPQIEVKKPSVKKDSAALTKKPNAITKKKQSA